MSPAVPWARVVADGVEVDVWVVPRASRAAIVGVYDGRLKLQIDAPPVDGAANAALCEALAAWLGVRRRDVRVVSGDSGRRKRLHVAGVPWARVLALVPSNEAPPEPR